MRIERHDIRKRNSYLPVPLTRPDLWPPERLALLEPDYHADGTLRGYRGTTLSDILWAEMQGRPWFGRVDIVLINEAVPCKCHCGHEHTHNEQHLVYPGPNGTLTGATHKLSPEDLEWALQESAKCWAIPELRRHIK